MNEVPKPNIRPDFSGPVVFREPSMPDIGSIGPVIGGATNFWCEGGVVPVASKLVDPSSMQLIFQLARDMLNTLADLGYLDRNIKGLTQQLGDAWPAGAGGQNALSKYVNIHGCFGLLGEQAGKLQQQTGALGGTLADSTMSLLTTLGISNGICAALGSNPFTAMAAKATAWGTVMKIVQWLLTIRSAIVAIADSVKAIKEVTQSVESSASALGSQPLQGYAQPAAPYPPSGLPGSYGGSYPAVPLPAGPMQPMPLPAGPVGQAAYGSQYGSQYGSPYLPSVYDSPMQSSGYPGYGSSPYGNYGGWVPEAADGVDADSDDNVEITISKDGAVTIEAPDDRPIDIQLDVDGKHYDLGIKPA